MGMVTSLRLGVVRHVVMKSSCADRHSVAKSNIELINRHFMVAKFAGSQNYGVPLPPRPIPRYRFLGLSYAQPPLQPHQ